MCNTEQNVIAYGRDHQTSYYNNFFLTSKQLSYWFCGKNITNKGAIEINKTYYTCVTVSGNIDIAYNYRVDKIRFGF